MSDNEAAGPALTEERARAILRPLSSHLADNLDRRCSCNSCFVCAAVFLVKMQGRLIGPTIIVTGWRTGMNKIGVGRTLHDAGLSIVDSHRMSNLILESFRRSNEASDIFDQGGPIQVQVADGVDRDALLSRLRELGVRAE